MPVGSTSLPVYLYKCSMCLSRSRDSKRRNRETVYFAFTGHIENLLPSERNSCKIGTLLLFWAENESAFERRHNYVQRVARKEKKDILHRQKDENVGGKAK